MLFIGPWHILIVIGVFLGCSAFLCAGGLLWLLAGIYRRAVKELKADMGKITPDDALGFIRGEDQHAE